MVLLGGKTNVEEARDGEGTGQGGAGSQWNR